MQQHLVLLREEYKKLQQHASALEARLALYSSAEKTIENGFLSRLHKTVSGLHQSAMYRYVLFTTYILSLLYSLQMYLKIHKIKPLRDKVKLNQFIKKICVITKRAIRTKGLV